MSESRRIAVLVEWSRAYGRGVLHGIAKYVDTHRTWKVYQTERGLSDEAPGWLRGWEGDGIIARIESDRMLQQIRRMKIPVVDLLEHRRRRSIPHVISNNHTIAQMAVDHLMQRGLRSFAYCGLPGVYSSDIRSQEFVNILQQHGFEVHVYENRQEPGRKTISTAEDCELRCEEGVATWVESLPKPVGLMACNDLRAHQVLMVCGDRGIAVPDDVAVIGVDNDELICKLCHPPLSSIQQNPERAGYEAATLLDRMIDGDVVSQEPIVVEPLEVVPRQSTDVMAVGDADVAEAIRFIRAHACEGIHVGNVVDHVQTSRSTLERRFNRLLGRSPKAEILRTQLDHVKRLLSMTEYPLERIAHLTGFQYTESMCYSFKRNLGQTPGQYRKKSQSRTF